MSNWKLVANQNVTIASGNFVVTSFDTSLYGMSTIKLPDITNILKVGNLSYLPRF
jgi:hypothetical protein